MCAKSKDLIIDEGQWYKINTLTSTCMLNSKTRTVFQYKIFNDIQIYE